MAPLGDDLSKKRRQRGDKDSGAKPIGEEEVKPALGWSKRKGLLRLTCVPSPPKEQ